LYIRLDHDPERVDVAVAQAAANGFVRLLSAAVAAPDVPLHCLEVLSAEERHTLLEGFNATWRAVPDASLPELFEAQVARTPDAIAVVFGEETLTYAELNARANQLAHQLIGQGVGAEALVGIALERSLEMVVALLGVLKSGAAYLPLDPAYPPARLDYIINDAAPAVVLGSDTNWQHR
jgi:non-ribosomal peptide synthetase component F